MGQESFAVPALCIVTAATVLLLRYFAAAETSWAVRLQVMLSWTLSLSIIALVPADIAATANNEDGARPGLGILWDLSYWTTFCLTWFVLPIHQIYEDAGDFSVGGRLRTSIRENLIFYAVIVLVAVLGVVLLVANAASQSPASPHSPSLSPTCSASARASSSSDTDSWRSRGGVARRGHHGETRGGVSKSRRRREVPRGVV